MESIEGLFDEHGEEICSLCKVYILSEINLGINTLCEGAYCEEAVEVFENQEDELTD